jgi:predicted PurR-regulated permease PerM
VLIAMIGGLLVFGIIGLVIGPLIIAYALTILEFYKQKKFSSIFLKEEENK